jgi:hypothetical protein
MWVFAEGFQLLISVEHVASTMIDSVGLYSLLFAVVSVFGSGGPSTKSTSEFCVACPCPDGLMQYETQEGG